MRPYRPHRPSSLTAQPAHELAHLVTTAGTAEWQPAGEARGFVLTLARPDGQVVTETFGAGRNPLLHVETLTDGQYGYELRTPDGDVQSGTFTVRRGAIMPGNLRDNPVTAARPGNPNVDTFFSDFVSAAGGLCGGSDCTSSETFLGPNIKLKANNTRLKFEDTSTSVGFPTTDWQITANDSTSGGANKLAFEDLTAATVPFTIAGAAPTNTLYVDPFGRVGIRTSTPAKPLTIDDAVSSSIRMEQSASPFQAWDVIANNTHFMVRDVNHETDPFIVNTSAPNNAILADASGRIGIGVASPSYQIHHSSATRRCDWCRTSSPARPPPSSPPSPRPPRGGLRPRTSWRARPTFSDGTGGASTRASGWTPRAAR